MVDHRVPRRRARHPGAVGQPAGRLAARCPEPEAAMILQAKNLRVEFRTRRGTLVAVDDVSFSVARGEVLGVVGESGAGKSLTGLAIMGLLEPPGRLAAGEVWLEGQRIDRLPQAALRAIRGRRIGVVFQDPLGSLNPLFTIGEQLEETIRTHLGLAGKELRQRALALLAEVGIPAPQARFHHYPHQFSGGMRQRVVIALALAAEPILLIADEPTTALDVSMQAQIIALIKRVARERGAAVMLITHDMGVIAETADRVAVMYAGRIVEIGAVRDVLHAPRRDPGAGRRVGLRQVDHRAPDGRARCAERRAHRVSRPAQADDLPVALCEPEPALARARHRRGADPGASACAHSGGGWTRRAASRASWAGGRRRRKVSPRVLRRPAPAHLDRARAVGR